MRWLAQGGRARGGVVLGLPVQVGLAPPPFLPTERGKGKGGGGEGKGGRTPTPCPIRIGLGGRTSCGSLPLSTMAQ